MSLTLLTHYHSDGEGDYQPLADLILPAREDYCARHGYVHHVHKGHYGDKPLYYAIERLYLLHDLMSAPGATEWYWALNISSILTNLTKPVLGEIEPDHRDFYVAHDCHGLNAGSFVVRNTEWGRAWIKLVADQSLTCTHTWLEQFVMSELERNSFCAPMIKRVEQRKINSYNYFRYPPWNSETPGDWRRGDLVLSLPGTPLAKRLEIIRDSATQALIIT